MRAISTVLDALLFLLLVSGAVVLLGGSHAPATRATTAHETADVLGASTATVTNPADTGSEPSNATDDRPVSGTLAELLAAAAVANATLDATELTASTDGFERAVTATVTSQVSDRTGGTQVTAVWRPYPGAPLQGAVTAGPAPPSDTEVHAATLIVPSGLAPVSGSESDGVGGVATAVAASVVDGLFPPRQTRMALAADGETASETRTRYRNVAAAVGTSPNGSLATNNATAANDHLETALATRLQRDLSSRYDTADAAGAAVRVGTVRITVRTWSV